MSEHKIGKSNWTDDQKGLYRQRRDKGLRGQLGIATVHQAVKDENGKDQLVPLGTKTGSSGSHLVRAGSGRAKDRRYTTRGHSAFVQRHMERKAARGE